MSYTEQLLTERWAARDLNALVSRRVRKLNAGSVTDWGLSSRQPDPEVPPISLAGGIPDDATLPRRGLLAATARALGLAPEDAVTAAADGNRASVSGTDPSECCDANGASALDSAARHGAQRGAAALSYGGPLGHEPLREQVARFFARDQEPAIGADHFVLANGAAGAIDLACSALLDPDDVVVTEVPAFSGSLRTIRGHGARLVGVPMDTQGMCVDRLDATLHRLAAAGTPAKLVYVSPTFHNPTGITMPIARRRDLLEVAARHGVLLLEDTAYNELYFGGELIPTLGALAQGHFVITAGTFSKVIAPGLRVGWLQARPELLEMLMPARFDMGNSPLQHRMLHEFMVSGELEAHVARMRALYRTKMRTLAAALRETCGSAFQFTEPDGGFFLWLRLAEPLQAQRVQEQALERGVVFPVGRGFYPVEGPRPDGEYLRLAYSRVGVDELRTGAERIAACLRKAGR
ncbi:MAG: PLP-dependent aminotransferase family protein [Spirochaetaceae bacterium]|nr:PLP-dependent aminotransferase family protein [Spirochaetaceae bacterium]